MPLMAHVTPRIVVPLLDDNSVALRGLNLDDFAGLLPNHFDALTKIVAMYQAHQESVFSTKPLTEFILAVAKDFPNLLSEVISMAADEPEARNVKLPITLQIAALSAIVKLTVEEAGGLGNLTGHLRALAVKAMAAAGVADASTAQDSNSSTGTGANK